MAIVRCNIFMHWDKKQWEEKRMEVASELMASIHTGLQSEVPRMANADCESELAVCLRLHLDFYFEIKVFISQA